MRRSTPLPGRRRTAARGQIVVIFGLMSLMLFATVGIAVDAGEAYLFSNQAERAAASAALAGVPYMPAGFGSSANTVAINAAGRGGFADGAMVNGYPVSVTAHQVGPVGCTTSCSMTACPVITPCDPHKLGVIVSGAVPTTFLNLLGFKKTTINQRAIALYLPPISLGQPGARLGPLKEADLIDPAKGAPYFIRTEGFASDRSQGDAYTPDTRSSGGNSCESYPSYGASNDVHSISAQRKTEVTDGTMDLAGMNRLPTRGGYNFAVTLPTAAKLQVYNPAFMMNGDGVNSGYTMHEGDSFPATPAPANTYSVMEYTVFRVVDQFDHMKDQPLAQLRFNPFDATDPIAGYIDENTGKRVSALVAASVYHAMVDIIGTPPTLLEAQGKQGVTSSAGIPNSLAAGSYRVRVDTLDNVGGLPGDGGSQCSLAHKGLSIQAVNPDNSPCALCQVSGLQELSLFTPLQAGTFTVPLFYVPDDYAGLTVNVYIYDVGDTSGNASVSLLTPVGIAGAGSTVVYAPGPVGVDIQDLGVNKSSSVTYPVNGCVGGSQPDPDLATVNTRYILPVTNSCVQLPSGPQGPTNQPWNGQWLRMSFPIPSNYTAGYYQLKYTTGGTSSDTITVAVGTNAVAVHLLP